MKAPSPKPGGASAATRLHHPSELRVRNDGTSRKRKRAVTIPTARNDVELDGVRRRKGERVMPMLVAANMDPRANENPERLDVQRRPNHHLSFGTGIHFCLGHQLARIEAMCALEALFTRWPDLRLAIEPAQVRWRKRAGLRAIATLPVTA